MQLSFADYLRRSWDHMLEVLFRPFDLGKWFVLGFAAWLAGLTSAGGGGGSGVDSTFEVERTADDFGEAAESLAGMIDYLMNQRFLLVLVALAMIAAFVLVVLLTWISSRGKFIFLDGVVRNDAQIREPWSRFREAGDSLFRFRFVFGVIQLAVGLFFGGALLWLLLANFSYVEAHGLAPLPTALALIAIFVLFAFLIAAANFALGAFVVPIMYRTGLPVMAAWAELGTLFSMQPAGFLACALIVFLLGIAVGVAVLIIGLMTCCFGFLLLMLPYIGTVLLLPVHVAYRAFTVIFLAAIDERFALISPPTPQSPAAPAQPLV